MENRESGIQNPETKPEPEPKMELKPQIGDILRVLLTTALVKLFISICFIHFLNVAFFVRDKLFL